MVEQIIMRIDSKGSGNFDFDHIVPAPGKSFPEQVSSCIQRLTKFIFPEEEPRYFVTQQTFFIAAINADQYRERADHIREQLSLMCGAHLPATSIVAQRPEAGSDVVLELICSRASQESKVNYKNYSGLQYTVVEYPGFKAVHCAGLTGDPGDPVRDAAEKAFEKGLRILGGEGLSINHIIRQWNYVEQIARIDGTLEEYQNYQVFNDVRSAYYERGHFSTGYPAATGIGMDTGGVVIDFIALSDSDRLLLKPIHNPGQIDAHMYSEKVLRGTPLDARSGKCPPKFERGKLVTIGSRNYVYVSGTAAITGEKTMYPGDSEKQTEVTIDNIYRLFTKENQEKLGLEFKISDISFSHLRVYVKHQEDISKVRKICQSRLNFSSSLFLVSDICREELLVEIEGVFTV